MQTSTKICKYQVTTTLKMSIGYLQILPLFFFSYFLPQNVMIFICRFLQTTDN